MAKKMKREAINPINTDRPGGCGLNICQNIRSSRSWYFPCAFLEISTDVETDILMIMSVGDVISPKKQHHIVGNRSYWELSPRSES
eukprot:scaffold1740_cov150-Skeletonema_dohrnii-CCMP3373.AAC.6